MKHTILAWVRGLGLALAVGVGLAGGAHAKTQPAPPQSAAPEPPTTQVEPFTPIDAHAQIARMARGVNILGYDPLWKDPAKARFQAADFARIHEGGFQTVRVNLQAFSHMDATDTLDPRWLATLDWVVDHALAAHLIVILDEHDFNLCSADPAGCRPKLLAFWRQIGRRYRSEPNSVLFELENEPHDPLTPQLWNGLLAEALAVVRQDNPTRTVVIGPGFYNNIHELQALRLPKDDRNIVVTVHYYLPMSFTHQGASWSKETVNLSGVTWGAPADLARLNADFDGVQQWSKANDRPILLGEFGAYEKAPLDSRVKYDSAVARAAEARGWAWAYWQFDSNFIVFDMGKHDWVQPIWRALIPEAVEAGASQR